MADAEALKSSEEKKDDAIRAAKAIADHQMSKVSRP